MVVSKKSANDLHTTKSESDGKITLLAYLMFGGLSIYMYTCILYNIHRAHNKHILTDITQARLPARCRGVGGGGTPEGKSETTGPAETTQLSPRSMIIMDRYLGAVYLYIYTHTEVSKVYKKKNKEGKKCSVCTLYIHNKEVKTITLVA